VYKRQFTRSKADVAYKAVTAAYDALRSKVATPGAISQAEKDAAEAAITTMKTASGEQDTALTALMDAIVDSKADTQYACFHEDARMVEMKAVLAEGKKLSERLKSTLKQEIRKDVTAEMGDMATTTLKGITMEEATLEYNTYLERFDAARMRNTEARAQTQAKFALTDLLLEGFI
jgi:hypothetical protein